MVDRLVLIELVGGPRDGEVIGWEFPPAQTIVFPVLVPTTFWPPPLVQPTHPIRRGHYCQRIKQPGFDVVTLDTPTDPKHIPGLGAWMKGQDNRPLIYHWEGEDAY